MFFTQCIALATLPLLLSAAPRAALASVLVPPLTNSSVTTRTSPDVDRPFSPPSSYYSHIPARHSIDLTKRVELRSTIALTSTTGDRYAATVTIGASTFRVLVDINTIPLILPGPECQGAIDAGRTIYNPPLPLPFPNETEVVRFVGFSDPAVGYRRPATVTLGELTADSYAVMVAQSLPEWLFAPRTDTDGVLGLGPPLTLAPTLFNTLVSEGKVDPNVFSLLLRRDINCHSKLTLGVPDDTLYRGHIQYAPVLTASSWNVEMQISFNGQPLVSNIHANVSTTSAKIFGDTASVQQFYMALSPESRRLDLNDDSGPSMRYWMFPCSVLDRVPIMMSFGYGPHATIPLSPRSLISHNIPFSDMCQGTVVEVINMLEDTWILGIPFFRDLYVVFDDGSSPRRVGFAEVSEAVKNEICTPPT